MGRNSGSKIMWTYMYETPTANPHMTWYCQQHGKWEQAGSTGNLIIHFLQHGLDEQ